VRPNQEEREATYIARNVEATRAAMDQLVVDNILAWAAGKPPLTPVPETPYPPKG